MRELVKEQNLSPRIFILCYVMLYSKKGVYVQ